MIKRLLALFTFTILLSISNKTNAQCTVYDGNGIASANPVWIGCSGASAAFVLNLASPNNYTGGYTVDWGDGTANTSGATWNANTPLVHNYAAAVDSHIVVITTGNPACTITGIVYQEKPVNASIQIPLGGVTTACAPKVLQFTNSSTDVSATTTFSWNFGDGSPIETYNENNVGVTVSHNYLPGTVNCQTVVTLSASNQCTFTTPTTAQFNPIQIYDKDDANITPSAFVKCWPDNTFDFTNSTNRNCVPQGNIQQRYEYWNFGDYWGLGHDSIKNWTAWPPALPTTIAYPAVGNYNVTLLDSNLCGIDTVTLTVSIVNAPTAGLTTPILTKCANSSFTFTNTSTLGFSYKWNFGDSPAYTNSSATTQTHTYNTAGTYTVSVVAFIFGAPSTCSDTAKIVITVLPRPTADFNVTPTQACDTATVSVVNTSITAVSQTWTYTGGFTSTAVTPANQFYNTTGTKSIKLVVTGANGCKDSTTKTVVIHASPVANFSPTSACQNDLTQFSDISTSSTDPITSWTWSFGDASPNSNLQNPTHTYTATGVYTVQLTANTFLCSDTEIVNVTIHPLPTASYTKSATQSCTPLNVNFNSTSVGASTFDWNFGDGSSNSSIAAPSHSFVNSTEHDTTFIVRLIVTSAFGCKDTIIDSVKVFGTPQASFTSNAIPACAPFPVTFTNTTTSATTYEWHFGDGTANSSLTNPTHLYTNQTLFLQAYNATLVATNAGGCVDSITQVVQAYPEPIFGFQMIPDSGCSPLTVNFPAVAGAVQYQWDFGDGNNSTGINPTHTYINNTGLTQTFNVELIATNAFSCSDTTNGNVVVFGLPTANFVPTTSLGCSPLITTLNNTSIGAANFSWDFDDGSPTTSAASPQHTFTNSSTSTSDTSKVKMIVTSLNGCKDTIIKNIIVYPIVVAEFAADTPICAPVAVAFQNLTLGGNSYNWNFGDGNLSGNFQPTHNYINPGPATLNYTTVLTATSSFGCTDTYSHTYAIFPTPVASLTASPLSQTYPATTVTFNNTSPSAGTYNNQWFFGDTQTSSLVQPGTHTYSTWGNYDVELVVSNTYCSDTARQTVTIIPPVPIANFKGKKSGCRPVTLSFTNLSQYATSYLWDFGDGSGSSVLPNPTYTYYNPGTFTVTLTANGPGGTNNIVGIDSVTVYDLPVAVFVANPTVIIVPTEAVQLTNLSQNANVYDWNFGDGSTHSTLPNPTHYYETAGQYQITLIATSPDGCRDTFDLPNLIYAQENSEIQVPNAFTPNPSASNGGLYDPLALNNDVFHPVIRGVTKYELSIFNRWGELIFESKDINIGWDGYYKGKLCQQDVYVWKVKVTTNEGQILNKSGDVLLVK